MEMRRKRLQGRGLERFCLLTAGLFILTEPESLQTADELALNRHFTLVVHFGQEGLLLLEPPQQDACPAIHKSLGQTFMQRI